MASTALALAITFAGEHALAQQPDQDEAMRYVLAVEDYHRCMIDYARRYAAVNATAADITDAATIACEEKAQAATKIKPRTLTDDYAMDRGRRRAIRAVVEERAKNRK